MKTCFSLLATLLIFYTASIAGAASLVDENQKAKYQACRESVEQGRYKSPVLEKLCVQEYDMPSPYLQKCLTWLRDKAFPTDIDKKSCQHFCEGNTNWGPWYDYEVPFMDKENFLIMKALNRAGKCF